MGNLTHKTRATLVAGDVVDIEIDISTIIEQIAFRAVGNDTGRAGAYGGLITAKVVKRVSESRRQRRQRERAERAAVDAQIAAAREVQSNG